MSIFGQSKPAGGSLFGAAPAGGSLFGQPQPAATQAGAGGPGFFTLSTNANPQASMQVASPPPAQNVAPMPALSQSQAQLSSSIWEPGQDTPHQKPILDQVQLVTEKWNPNNPANAFKFYFYNKVDEANIPFYKPQPFEDPKEWEEALQKKPAPGFMPVLCSGFEQLAERLKTQRRAVADFNVRLHQINASLDAILSRHDLETSVRALAARRRHLVISDRALALAARVQVLRNRGYAMSADEDDLRLKLQGLEKDLQDPALSAKEEELWSRLIVVRGYAEQLTQEINKARFLNGEGIGDMEEKAKKVMEDFEKQILHLKREVESIAKELEKWEKGRKPA